MDNSITVFLEKGRADLEKIFTDHAGSPEKIAEMVQGVAEEVMKLGTSMIGEEWTAFDQLLRKRRDLRPGWQIVRTDKTSLLTSLGEVHYEKTLFRNREAKKSCYLLDSLMGRGKHGRMTEDAEAGLLEEAACSSYRRGGEAACPPAGGVSRETAMNHVRDLEFPKETQKKEEKKRVDFLYMEADEDHLALQFREKKGDLIKYGNGNKNNGLLVRLVYVHEGLAEKEGKERHSLVSPHFFCRVCSGKKEDDALWDEVWEYMDAVYDMDSVKKVYLDSDGGGWIMSGARRLHGVSRVLDGFHLSKYLTRLAWHFGEAAGLAREELREIIRKGTKQEFSEAVALMKGLSAPESREKRIRAAETYILGNWGAAKLRLAGKDGVLGSSTEGHVYHVLSSRMSTRPMGWCREGAAKMARLLAYRANGGDMLELARFQKQEIPLAAGAEEAVLSSAKVFASERKNRKKAEKIGTGALQGSIPFRQMKKIAALKDHIFGL